jgi:hypothetical protein
MILEAARAHFVDRHARGSLPPICDTSAKLSVIALAKQCAVNRFADLICKLRLKEGDGTVGALMSRFHGQLQLNQHYKKSLKQRL